MAESLHMAVLNNLPNGCGMAWFAGLAIYIALEDVSNEENQ